MTAGDLALLLQSSVQSLTFAFNTLERGSFAMDTFAAQHLARAFSSNTTLQHLEFNHLVAPAAFLPAIFRSLHAHPTLNKISYTPTPSVTPLPVAVASSIGNMLGFSTGSLAEVEFIRIQWDEMAFGRFANGLKNTKTLSKLSLHHCSFDASSSLSVPTLFQSEFALDTLDIVVSMEDKGVLGNLAGFTRGLKMPDLTAQTAWGTNGETFKTVVDALTQTSSGVERIRFGVLSPTLCNSLIAGLPTFRSLREIGFVLDDTSLQLKDQLLSAFRRNYSLTNLDFVDAPFWDEMDRSELCWCAHRNATLPSLLLTVGASQKGTALSRFLPRLLEMSLESTAAVGPTDVFGALTAFADRVVMNESEEEEESLMFPEVAKVVSCE